jgi:hypothetical protein
LLPFHPHYQASSRLHEVVLDRISSGIPREDPSSVSSKATAPKKGANIIRFPPGLSGQSL